MNGNGVELPSTLVSMTSTPSFREVLADRVMVADGAMGTMLQAHDVTLDD